VIRGMQLALPDPGERARQFIAGRLSYRSFFTPRHQLRTTLSGH
jgi:hypothetical protein